jgi:tRNA-Thr(GGU) m(6)t(6)A37 methyltransferase TsaA
MEITPIARFRSPLTSKFGIPRQGGLAHSLEGQIVFEPAYRHEEAVRGLEQFSHLWIIWAFSANSHQPESLTVRPPRLGGNERVGVFASRSPFRPNALGLSCVHINKVEMTSQFGPVIHVDGADLVDGTPIYDIKPYVVYADCHPEARSGFVDEKEWNPLEVVFPDDVVKTFTDEQLEGLRQVLALDPRPQYHQDAERVYGMNYLSHDIRFMVDGGKVIVKEIV